MGQRPRRRTARNAHIQMQRMQRQELPRMLLRRHVGARHRQQGGLTMTHRYIATFVYTARVPIYAEDEYEAEDMADEIPEDRYIDNLTFDHIDIEEE